MQRFPSRVNVNVFEMDYELWASEVDLNVNYTYQTDYEDIVDYSYYANYDWGEGFIRSPSGELTFLTFVENSFYDWEWDSMNYYTPEQAYHGFGDWVELSLETWINEWPNRKENLLGYWDKFKPTEKIFFIDNYPELLV